MLNTTTILFLVYLLVLALSLAAIEAVKPTTVTKPAVELKLDTISKPGELTATYCTKWTVASNDGMTITLSHSTDSGTTIYIDMSNQACHIVGSARVQYYNGEIKVTSPLDEDFVHVTLQGVHGTMILSVRSWTQVPA